MLFTLIFGISETIRNYFLGVLWVENLHVGWQGGESPDESSSRDWKAIEKYSLFYVFLLYDELSGEQMYL